MHSTKQAEVHCLTDLPSSKNLISDCIRKQFENIIAKLSSVLKDKNGKKMGDKVSNLVSAMCWNYTVDDFKWLLSQEILITLGNDAGSKSKLWSR